MQFCLPPIKKSAFPSPCADFHETQQIFSGDMLVGSAPKWVGESARKTRNTELLTRLRELWLPLLRFLRIHNCGRLVYRMQCIFY